MSDSAQQDQAAAAHQDIEKQLDALLGGMPAGASQSTRVDAKDAQEASPSAAQAAEGDALVDQIQQMLDEARARVDETESAGAQSGGSAAVEAVTTQAVGEGDKSVDGSQLVQELDDLLADEADGAVAGEFETPEQVLSVAATPDAGGGASSPAAGGEAVDRDLAGPNAADEDEDSLDGAFETPEELMARAREEEAAKQAKPAVVEAKEPASAKQAAPAGRPAKAAAGFGAAAADVARELDEQEAAAAAPTAEIKAAAPSALDRALAAEETDAPAEAPATPAKPRGPSKIKAAVCIVPNIAKGICAAVNRPLASLAPQTRNTIGYVGLLTVFNASVLLIYKICTTMF